MKEAKVVMVHFYSRGTYALPPPPQQDLPPRPAPPETTSLDTALDSGGPELLSALYFTASAANGDYWKYARLMKEYRRNPDGWKEKYEYGKRSPVESVFGTVKVKFRGTLRSRRGNRSTVETQLKLVIHNAESTNYLSWFNP